MTRLVVVIGCAACACAGTVLLRAVAIRRNWHDTPNHRSSHTKPTPRLGGVAVATVSLLAWTVLRFKYQDSQLVAAMMIGAGCCAAIGFVDDLRAVSPLVKFGGEALAVGLAISTWPALATAPIVIQLLVGLLLLTYTNFFNFMDGSDGLAAGTAVCAAIGLALISGPSTDVAQLLLPAGAAAAGFLIWNYPPASIFMGDAGSLFLGFALAFGAVIVAQTTGRWIAPAVVLTPFLFDAGFTLARRATAGKPVWRAHRSHLYQRLLSVGFSHRMIALTYWAWGAACAAVGITASRTTVASAYALSGVALFPGAALAMYVRALERRGRIKSGDVREHMPLP